MFRIMTLMHALVAFFVDTNESSAPLKRDSDSLSQDPSEQFAPVIQKMSEYVGKTSGLSVDVFFVDSLKHSGEANFSNNICRIDFHKGIWNSNSDHLFPRVENDSEFAVVLGHEIAHCLVQRTLSQQIDKQFSNIRRQQDEERRNYATKEEQEIGSTLASLRRYLETQERRAKELEADEIGFRLAVGAGFDPGAGADLWCRHTARLQEEPCPDHDPLFRFDSVTCELDSESQHPPTTKRCVNFHQRAQDYRQGWRW